MGSLVEFSTSHYLEVPQSQPRPLAPDVHPIRRILVCIDGSPFSESCLQHAVSISKSLGGAITILHVMEPAHERSGVQTTDLLDWEVARQQAAHYLERLKQEGTKALGAPIETRLEQGHPAERITAVARELETDLTVLASRGERGEAEWSLGSTVQQVLAVAGGSVLVVRSSEAVPSAVFPKRLLLPLDGSLRAESVLPAAVRIASPLGAELLLAFVVPEPVATAVLRTPEDLDLARHLASRLETGAKRYLQGLRDQLVRAGASVRTLVLRSPDERRALLELSRKEHSDLIVVSAHGSTCNPALPCGSVTAHLLAHSGVTLLVLQDLRDSEPRRKDSQPAPALRARFPEGV
jgi:nucleotide-binding universal stress UspA family protein